MSGTWPAETTSNVVTSWIPLTTALPSPLACSNSLMLEGNDVVAYAPEYSLSVNPFVTCLPPAVMTVWKQKKLSVNYALSILPLNCPTEFSTVATSIRSESSTLMMCCPPNYSLRNGIVGEIVGDCASTLASGATLTYASPDPTQLDTPWPMVTTVMNSASLVYAFQKVGWTVNLPGGAASSTVMASETGTTSSYSSPTNNTPSSSSTPVTSNSSPISSSTSASSSQSIPMTSTTVFIEGPTATSSTHPALSTPTKVGLGVGIVLIIILTIAMVTLWSFLRRRKAKLAVEAPKPQPPDDPAKPELDGEALPSWKVQGQRYELGERDSVELDGDSMPVWKMPGYKGELEGGEILVLPGRKQKYWVELDARRKTSGIVYEMDANQTVKTENVNGGFF